MRSPVSSPVRSASRELGRAARAKPIWLRLHPKPPHGPGPRIHDIRHAFAVERVRQWYREGKDVQSLLPRLVTYLGHRGLESTQLYLSVTPAVLHEASSRFEQFTATLSHDREVKP